MCDAPEEEEVVEEEGAPSVIGIAAKKTQTSTTNRRAAALCCLRRGMTWVLLMWSTVPVAVAVMVDSTQGPACFSGRREGQNVGKRKEQVDVELKK